MKKHKPKRKKGNQPGRFRVEDYRADNGKKRKDRWSARDIALLGGDPSL